MKSPLEEVELENLVDFKPFIEAGQFPRIFDNCPCARYTLFVYDKLHVYFYHIEYEELVSIHKSLSEQENPLLETLKKWQEAKTNLDKITKDFFFGYIQRLLENEFRVKQAGEITPRTFFEDIKTIDEVNKIEKNSVEAEADSIKEVVKSPDWVAAEVMNFKEIIDSGEVRKLESFEIAPSEFLSKENKAVATLGQAIEKRPIQDRSEVVDDDSTYVKADIPSKELTRIMTMLRIRLPRFTQEDISISVGSIGDRDYSAEDVLSGKKTMDGNVLVIWHNLTEHGKDYLDKLRKELAGLSIAQ